MPRSTSSLTPRSTASRQRIAGYIADACALIAFFGSQDAYRLMPHAAPIMASQPVRVSPITVWEITRKVAIGKLAPVWLPYPSLGQFLRAQMFTQQPFGWDESEAANKLPLHHKDPMDRMLIATALMHNLAILTDDGSFASYGVATVW
ncbi:MAG TPA: type II toxin-antitoxin system VapC family toxin [Acetobacteraceae bacterium]